MARHDWMKDLGWNESHLDAMRNIAYSYIRQGKYDIALPFFETLVILDPQNIYDAQMLGALYVQLNQPEKAIRVLDKALQIDADHGPTLLNLMKAFFMSGKKKEGLRLASVLRNDDDPYIAANAQAMILCYT